MWTHVFKLHCGHNVGEAARGDDLLGQFWGVARQLGHGIGGGLRHGGNLHREHGATHTHSGKRGARIVCVVCVVRVGAAHQVTTHMRGDSLASRRENTSAWLGWDKKRHPPAPPPHTHTYTHDGLGYPSVRGCVVL